LQAAAEEEADTQEILLVELAAVQTDKTLCQEPTMMAVKVEHK
jgi:hypothetical protein